MTCLTLDINLDAAQATFFRRLQHQLDVIKILQVGCAAVTAEQVENEYEFDSFVPANWAKLSHDQAKAEANDWLIRGFLRDAIEGTGLFLDECLLLSDLMQKVKTEAIEKNEFEKFVKSRLKNNHKLRFPKKLENLNSFGISTRFDAHILSLNRARNCVVHRLANVGEQDVDATGVLRVVFQRMRLIARGKETGEQFILNQPGVVVTEESMLELHWVDDEMIFRRGEKIRLRAQEVYAIIITLFRFGHAALKSIEEYGKSIGINFDSPKSEA